MNVSSEVGNASIDFSKIKRVQVPQEGQKGLA